jgi:hypothetical protein
MPFSSKSCESLLRSSSIALKEIKRYQNRDSVWKSNSITELKVKANEINPQKKSKRNSFAIHLKMCILKLPIVQKESFFVSFTFAQEK